MDDEWVDGARQPGVRQHGVPRKGDDLSGIGFSPTFGGIWIKPLEQGDVMSDVTPEVAEILRKAGLDPADPEVLALASEPVGFDEFNARLDALIARKRKPGS